MDHRWKNASAAVGDVVTAGTATSWRNPPPTCRRLQLAVEARAAPTQVEHEKHHGHRDEHDLKNHVESSFE
jgi:hypothetical protein